MKTLLSLTIVFIFVLTSCENPLQEQVHSQIGPSNFYKSEKDAKALLNSAYAEAQMQAFPAAFYLWMNELNSDIMFDRGGGLERILKTYEDFTWDATHPHFEAVWEINYRIVLRTNLAIERIPDIPMSDQAKQTLTGEARFLRAYAYFFLFDLFGPTPLITTSEQPVTARPARATEEEMISFIETQFREAADMLPAQAAEVGRATRGAALGMLCKFHLNNKKWQQTADVAQEIIDSGIYALFDSKNRTDLFKVANEVNSEFIFVRAYEPEPGLGFIFLPRSAPPQYQFKYPPKENFATNYKIYSDFYNSFHPDDERRDAIITEYVNTSGDTVQLGEDDFRSFKYQEDPNGTGRWAGNDVPVVRYADILLSRAEALNEINGPNQESIDLINMVREKAGVPLKNLADFPTKASLRDHILKERAWELFNEEKRRQDLIRMGKFIEMGQARGKAAQDFHRRFPIPQSELDKNPNLTQNPGYAGGG